MKRRLFLIAILSCLPFLIWGQELKITWKRGAMDSTYMSERIFPIDKIIADHQEAMGSLMEILIYSSEEIDKGQPEGALSNLASGAFTSLSSVKSGSIYSANLKLIVITSFLLLHG